MQLPNPVNKLYTLDIFPDDGEMGNAMWGYHIANNFSRLFMAEHVNRLRILPHTSLATNSSYYYWGNTAPVACLEPVQCVIDISRYRFHAAPIVQHWVSVYPTLMYPELNPNWIDSELSGDHLKIYIRACGDSASSTYLGANGTGHVATIVTRIYGA